MANPQASTVFASVFTDILLEKYRDGNAAVLNELTSMDHMVQYNKINLSEIGADPDVVENNSTWPLVPAQRTDSGIEIALSTFDTKPTHITNVDELETNYDKAKSVLTQHVDAIINHATKSALFNLAPASNTDKTPVVATKGTTFAYADILALRTKFNKLNLPQEGRVLVLAPEHEEALLAEDVDRYNRIMTTGQVAGFKILVSTGLPTYTSLAKDAVDAAVKGKTASIAWCRGEVFRAKGDVKVDAEERWADYRGWLIGAQMRFVALPVRGLGLGAIVTK